MTKDNRTPEEIRIGTLEEEVESLKLRINELERKVTRLIYRPAHHGGPAQ